MSNPKRTRKEIREAIKKIKIKRELKQYEKKLVKETPMFKMYFLFEI